MNLKEYQRAAARTAAPADDWATQLMVYALGLCGEAGEFGEHIKKAFGHDHTLDHLALQKELGDVMWYWANLHEVLGMDPEATLQMNVDKLRRRYPAGFTTQDSLERRDA